MSDVNEVWLCIENWDDYVNKFLEIKVTNILRGKPDKHWIPSFRVMKEARNMQEFAEAQNKHNKWASETINIPHVNWPISSKYPFLIHGYKYIPDEIGPGIPCWAWEVISDVDPEIHKFCKVVKFGSHSK